MYMHTHNNTQICIIRYPSDLKYCRMNLKQCTGQLSGKGDVMHVLKCNFQWYLQEHLGVAFAWNLHSLEYVF